MPEVQAEGVDIALGHLQAERGAMVRNGTVTVFQRARTYLDILRNFFL